jgi:hypothetical protein
MTIVVIPPSANTLADAKGIINNNFGEVEMRLQGIEILSFMRDGDGPPTNDQFNNGDYYIDRSDWSLWKKEDGVWASETSLAGNPGPAGPKGSPGLVHRGVWSSATAYNIDDAVRYRGSYWRAVRFIGDGTEPTTANTTSWLPVARGINNMGSWAQGTVYRVDDMVRYLGEWYILIGNLTSTATTPDNDSANYTRVVSKGDEGPAGPEGPEGPQGDVGPQGPIGAGLVNRGSWSSVTAYAVNDAVSYRGAFWAAKLAHTNIAPANSGAGATNWAKLVRGLNPMAVAWSQGAIYQQDDLVPHNGSLYLVLQDHTASATQPNLDTTNYRLYASKGDQGIQGPQGQQGIQGEIGPTPTTYEWYKFFRGGTGISGPLTGGGWERVTTNRTITGMWVRIDGWSATTAPLVVALMYSQNGAAAVEIGRVTLDNTTSQIRGANTSLSQVVNDTYDLRADIISGGAVNNLTVIARGQ